MASSSNNNTNVENITNKVATVALDDEEIEVEDMDFHEEQSVTKYDLQFALVGRFLTERFIRLNEMSQVMAANWRPGMGISIQDIYPQRFLFQFGHEADIRRIQESGPWTYDNHPLIFERVAQGDNLDKVDLNELAMWIQLHDTICRILLRERLEATWVSFWSQTQITTWVLEGIICGSISSLMY